MKVKLELDRRELTLIRVACLQRLDRLNKPTVGEVLADPPLSRQRASYEETRALLQGVLGTASIELRKLDAAEGQ